MAIADSHTDTARGQAVDRPAASPATARSEWSFVGVIAIVALVLTAAPYVFATATAPADKHFVGLALNIPDHIQYFSWMRDLSTQNLASDRLTPEPNEPALFNLLWWAAGRIGVAADLDYAALHTLLRLLALPLLLGCAYAFLRVVAADSAQRRVAFLIFTFGGGLGIVWIGVKYLAGLTEAPFPFDIYTSEPNTFINLMAFPHFSIALALIIATFGLLLVALKRRQWRYAVASGVVALILGLQHTYDLVTIYAVLGLFGLLTWLRDRRFPAFLLGCGMLIAGISAPPALYSFLLVKQNPLWSEVLAQFDLAGAFTPNPLHLPVLLGVPLLLAIAAFRPAMLKSRSDAEMFIAAWFIAHLPLVYLPVDFQIHLLLGWQMPIAILAAAALARIAPALSARTRIRPTAIAAGLIALSLMTNGYVLLWRFIELRRYEAPYFLSRDDVAALDWLAENTTAQDVVLASLDFGQWVPTWSDARAFVAHWTGTLDFLDKRDAAQAFVEGRLNEPARQSLLDTYRVTYVVHGGQDDPSGIDALNQSLRLSPEFIRGDTIVYRVGN